ncbi:unnamed protein product [Brassica oleracea var. botrytis]|uniref:Ubiquitin-like protease family profile domain-containing protein n=2 Tax=Brassica TaxID=3705 RepID=A0A0D3CBP3_BRAOL|nr:unnamed protein product [Brassica napus]CDY44190.1 BnaC05g15470D [Brassica napus]
MIENVPEKAPEPITGPSVVVLDKQVPTVSDVQQEEARRQTKMDAAVAFAREKSDRVRKLAASQQSPFQGNSTGKVIIPNTKVGQGYDLFAPVDKKKMKVLFDWLKLDPDAFINILRLQYHKNPHHFRSGRIYFLDHVFSRIWRDKYPEFKSSEPDHNGCKKKAPWRGVDDIYAPVNFKNTHWIAIWILIPKKHIVIWDSIAKHISDEELAEVMEPDQWIIPYLLVECAGSGELCVQYTLKPFTYMRVTAGVSQCRAGDCGVFTLMYIECHALGMSFSPAFSSRNVKAIREKMAVDIFQEAPESHDKENNDNDENVTTYEQ